jgi:hypothetical protein
LPISRPEPPLVIPQTNEIICTGSKNFTLNGLPSGATTVWSLSSNANASTSSPTNSSVTVTRNTNVNTQVNLIATVTHCSFTYTKSVTIVLGTPSLGYAVYPYYQGQQFCTNSFGNTLKIEPQNLGNISVEWTSLNLSDPNYNLIMVNSSGGVEQDFVFYTGGMYQIAARTVNSCGQGDYTAILNIEVSDNCNGGGSFRLQNSTLNIYPNPTKGMVKIQIPKEYQKSSQLEISNQMGTIVILKKLKNSASNLDIDLSNMNEGVYQITLRAGKNTIKTKVIKQ